MKSRDTTKTTNIPISYGESTKTWPKTRRTRYIYAYPEEFDDYISNRNLALAHKRGQSVDNGTVGRDHIRFEKDPKNDSGSSEEKSFKVVSEAISDVSFCLKKLSKLSFSQLHQTHLNQLNLMQLTQLHQLGKYQFNQFNLFNQYNRLNLIRLLQLQNSILVLLLLTVRNHGTTMIQLEIIVTTKIYMGMTFLPVDMQLVCRLFIRL